MKILIGTNTFGKYKRQDIAIDSYRELKNEFPDVVDIIDVQFEDEITTFENHYNLDVTHTLTRSSLDVVEFGEKKLPFVNDIFSILADSADDYCIFVNSDVIINKTLIKYIIDNQPECFACSRLEISELDSFSELRVNVKPIRWEIAGFDVFIFKKDWFLKYSHLFNDYLLGCPQFDPVYAGIMKCFGDSTPLGNQYPPFCFHIKHDIAWLGDSPEKEFNTNAITQHPLDAIISNLMFFNLKNNLCRRKPWGAFLYSEGDEQVHEKLLFDNFNVHIGNNLT